MDSLSTLHQSHTPCVSRLVLVTLLVLETIFGSLGNYGARGTRFPQRPTWSLLSPCQCVSAGDLGWNAGAKLTLLTQTPDRPGGCVSKPYFSQQSCRSPGSRTTPSLRPPSPWSSPQAAACKTRKTVLASFIPVLHPPPRCWECQRVSNRLVQVPFRILRSIGRLPALLRRPTPVQRHARGRAEQLPQQMRAERPARDRRTPHQRVGLGKEGCPHGAADGNRCCGGDADRRLGCNQLCDRCDGGEQMLSVVQRCRVPSPPGTEEVLTVNHGLCFGAGGVGFVSRIAKCSLNLRPPSQTMRGARQIPRP